jgi:transcriptional regulator with GAF, ATPase, and Fis domain
LPRPAPRTLESELFGHERGAFTGATASRTGRFEQATKGTLFLDEIGDLPTELQPKLLTVLQDREFFRVGGSKQLETNARVIAATNINLRERVEQGTFREDLYYRLNIIELHIPSLRDRTEDIPALVTGDPGGHRPQARHRRLADFARAMDALSGFDWPGNIRQLQNVLERATAFPKKPNCRSTTSSTCSKAAAKARPVRSRVTTAA